MALTGDQYYSISDQPNNSFSNIDSQKDDVTYERKELTQARCKYTVIQDCMDGQTAIKAKRQTYLPIPNQENQTQKNKIRYEQLLDRAIFANFVSPTVLGLKGQSFIYPPSVTVPDRLKPIIKNVNGSYGINQLAENIMTQTLSINRGGLFTDFPSIDREMSVSDKEKIMPSIIQYMAGQIINWGDKVYDGKIIKSMIVLRECYDSKEGRFKPTFVDQYRVLGLDENNEFYVELWREMDSGDYKSVSKMYPLDGLGIRWNEIPFSFLSSEGDTSCIIQPPMFDIACVNIGHYRNSASYEDSCNMVGEPTLVISGLPSGWLEDELGGKIMMGSRGGIPLPVGADAKLLQVLPNTMVYEAMLHKESQMISMGAKMLTPSNVVKTATESVMDNSDQNSILMSNSKNNSIALTKHLGYCDKYLTGSIDESIAYKLLTETALTNMTPNEEMQTVASWMAGILTDNETRKIFKDAGKAWDDKWKAPVMLAPYQQAVSSASTSGTVNVKDGRDFIGNKNN